MNVAVNLERAANFFPNETAVIEGERTISYAEFNRDATQIASAISALGVQPGEHIALCAPNSYQWLAFYFGTLKAGAVAVTFSHLSSIHEIRKMLSDSNPKLFFTVDEKLESLEDREAGAFPECVICDGGDIRFSELAAKGSPSFNTVERDRQDVAAILYTGGTTGTPKGAMLTHANLMTSAFSVARYERTSHTDRGLLFLPLNHVFGQVHVMHSMVFAAGGLIVQNGFNIENVLNAIEQHKVSNFYAVPTIYIRLMTLENLREKLQSIRYCFSAATSMAVEIVREWKAKTGLNIFECYGMTESAAMVTYNHYYRHVVGSVGTPVNLVEVQIRDENGNALPQGKKGEICICGPNIFKGYLNNPEETASAFWGDWFRSGDIGILDESGYLYIVDRLKDMIITGGENVYPREVEEVLYTWPAVSECAVVGLADREYGERVTAFIVSQYGCSIDPVELKEYLKTQLPGFKIPKDFVVVNDIPKSSAGKLLKRELKKSC